MRWRKKKGNDEGKKKLRTCVRSMWDLKKWWKESAKQENMMNWWMKCGKGIIKVRGEWFEVSNINRNDSIKKKRE